MTEKGKRLSPMDLLNQVREKAKLNDTTGDFSKLKAIRLKAGKIKFQLLALKEDVLFKCRTQHMLPPTPNSDEKENWLVCDCVGKNCPVCVAANKFKNSNINIEDVNFAYKAKYPYKNLKSVFTQPEHFLLCAKVLEDKADDGTYLPKDSSLGSIHLLQFSRMALNNLMAAYEDFYDNWMDGEDDSVLPPLFSIFDEGKTAKSLTISCRISMQPYSCSFSFGSAKDITITDDDIKVLELLEYTPEIPKEHYETCVSRIQSITNYFVQPKNNIKDGLDDIDTFGVGDVIDNKITADRTEDDDDFNIDDLL